MPQASGGSKIVETFGYVTGSDSPVFSKTYTADGTCAVAGSVSPGDAAALVRYSTAARSSKNHPIYCFSYYHGINNGGGAGTSDYCVAAAVTAMGVYAAIWVGAGFSDGTHTMKRTSPAGHDCTGYLVEALLTHRDLPH